MKLHQFGVYSDRPCIATHDLALIEKAKNIIKKQNIKNAEIQFSFGIREKLAQELVQEGFKTIIYVPYGNIITYLSKGLFTFDNVRNIQRLLRFRKIY
ncbi:MAG: proline dehydrogenase family protein [Patescibacteria group bacterium]